jgi:uncharacterized protein VirK/YbjX
MATVQESPAVARAAVNDRHLALRGSAPGSGTGKLALLDSSLKLASQGHRFYLSPARFARLLWAFATNIVRQLEIFRILALPTFTSLLRLEPIFPFKHLTRGYLVRGLSSTERAASFVHHYRRLNAIFPSSILRKILYKDSTLLKKQVDGHLFSVRFGLARKEVREGELALALLVDGLTVYLLQFTIVPGWVVKSPAADVLLVSRLQGMKGCYSQVRLATKAFLDVAPPALLLASLHGIAKACAIDEMAGISAASQFSYVDDCADSFRAAYDDFWIELGAKRISASFFASPIPPQEKSLDTVTNGHKSRTRKKRAFKQQIADDVFRLLSETNPVCKKCFSADCNMCPAAAELLPTQ